MHTHMHTDTHTSTHAHTHAYTHAYVYTQYKHINIILFCSEYCIMQIVGFHGLIRAYKAFENI